MVSPTYITLTIDKQPITIKLFDRRNNPQETVLNKAINIFASGPSIAQIIFNAELLKLPSMFVNGSLSLVSEHHFSNVVGYVISDARFIKHNGEVLRKHYKGQPLYCTLPVIDAITSYYPELITQYHTVIRIIYPVDRPLNPTTKKQSLMTRFIVKKCIHKKMSLSLFRDHSNFIVDTSNPAQAIGVSLDITDGFVEAGTVAYVAAQLAYSLGASDIHLYGVDLINSDQPRFYESKDNAAPCKLDKAISDRIVPSFNLMAIEYKKRGVAMINHSPVSQGLFG